ncbi:hypothetical protein [Streptomyces boluensis]|uniref:Uncharacterized protein n=1 Tax=Streptomyces boluensis TaxID=1775135 RepID=A0A964UNM5_9ACTN|nr:hypothetical protein [Streptomyces boluensis]NBE52391.1 hypothetical protein [Streptomyces boluensis]
MSRSNSARIQRSWALAVAGCVVLVGCGGGGTGDDPAAARPCHGIVPQAQVEGFLDARGTPMDDLKDRADEEPQQCNFRPDGGSDRLFDELDVEVGRSTSSGELLRNVQRRQSDTAGYTVSPIGHGWRGVLNTTSADATAAVVMLCEGKDGKGGDGLTVNLTARQLGGVHDEITEPKRLELARLATATAVNAAERAGCEAPRGKTVRKLAEPVPETGPGTPARAASGTCEGIDARTRETAADPLAPVEDCVVLDAKGEPAFRVAAYYGPFVQDGSVATYKRGDSGLFDGPSGGADGVYWASASCPAQGGTAFFTSETVRKGERLVEPDPGAQRAALKELARRSAERHSCAQPRFDG